MPAELAVVERILQSYYPQPDAEARAVAKQLLAVCLKGDTPVDWDEIRRLAGLPAFGVASELETLMQEVSSEINVQI